MRTEMRRPISLDDFALFRFALIRVGDDHTLWFQKYHHIIIDATGRRLLSERTARRYRALRFGEPLAALDAATPEELLDTERRYTSSASHEADRRYWLEQFAQWPGPLLEMDRRSTERARSGIHERIGFALKRDDFTQLETAARKMGSSAFRVNHRTELRRVRAAVRSLRHRAGSRAREPSQRESKAGGGIDGVAHADASDARSHDDDRGCRAPDRGNKGAKLSAPALSGAGARPRTWDHAKRLPRSVRHHHQLHSGRIRFRV